MCFLLVFLIILTDLVIAASMPKISQPTDQFTSVTYYSVNLIYPVLITSFLISLYYFLVFKMQPVTAVVRFMYQDEKYNVSVFKV